MNAWLTMAALALLTVAPASQEPARDRKKVPVPARTPELRVPAWTKSTLADGRLNAVQKMSTDMLVEAQAMCAINDPGCEACQ